MIKNYPTHGLSLWMIVQMFHTELNFVSRNLLDSSAGTTYMGITLGEAMKLLDNMTTNYSQWHTVQAPTGRKGNFIEEGSTLSEKTMLL